jgi:hypothetical protein
LQASGILLRTTNEHSPQRSQSPQRTHKDELI